jgi:hypothetical protein
MNTKKLYTIANWSDYNSTPAPIFTSKKEAELVARLGRELRAKVYVIEM